MIVIRSKPFKGKMHRLAKEIEKLSCKNKVLIIDMGYVYEIFQHLDNSDYVRLDDLSNVEIFIKAGLDHYDYFALNLCIPVDGIKYFQEIEDEYNTKFILTVQEHVDSENEEVLIEVV